MKQNKFVYLIIFSLVFLGFTNGVKAGCCYKENGTWKYRSDLQSTGCITWGNSSRNNAFDATHTECTAKNNEGKFCCDTTTGTNNGKQEGACKSSTDKWTDETGCADAYNYNTHQCCNSSGEIITSDKSQCQSTDNAAKGYLWRTVYECASLKKICCENNSEYPSMRDESSCLAYGRNKYGANSTAVKWVDKATCVGITDASTRDTVNHIDYTNPYVTPTTPTTPTNNPSGDPDNNHSGNGTVDGYSGTTGTDTMTVGFNCDDPDINSIVKTVKTIYNLLRYSVPVILIIMGSIDFLKATIAGKEDEIEKHKKTFINRLFLAVIIFMLLSIFQLVTNILETAGVANSNSWIECWNHINN